MASCKCISLCPQLLARIALVEKQSTDETPMTGNPKADALKLTLENLPKDDSYDDVRAVLVDKAQGCRPGGDEDEAFGSSTRRLRSGNWKSCQRSQEAEDIIKIAEVVRRNAEDEENKLKPELLQLQSSAAEENGWIGGLDRSDECIAGESSVRDEREPVR